MNTLPHGEADYNVLYVLRSLKCIEYVKRSVAKRPDSWLCQDTLNQLCFTVNYHLRKFLFRCQVLRNVLNLEQSSPVWRQRFCPRMFSFFVFLSLIYLSLCIFTHLTYKYLITCSPWAPLSYLSNIRSISQHRFILFSEKMSLHWTRG